MKASLYLQQDHLTNIIPRLQNTLIKSTTQTQPSQQSKAQLRRPREAMSVPVFNALMAFDD